MGGEQGKTAQVYVSPVSLSFFLSTESAILAKTRIKRHDFVLYQFFMATPGAEAFDKSCCYGWTRQHKRVCLITVLQDGVKAVASITGSFNKIANRFVISQDASKEWHRGVGKATRSLMYASTNCFSHLFKLKTLNKKGRVFFESVAEAFQSSTRFGPRGQREKTFLSFPNSLLQ